MRNFSYTTERGNVLFMILIAVILIGALSVTIMNSGDGDNAHIDRESLILKAAQVRAQAGEFERGVQYILHYGASEDSIRFAHADAHADYGSISTTPALQLFHPDGGAASYPAPPSGINDGSGWEFYGHTAAPATGSDRADLIAVLPNVTQDFCTYVNENNEQPAAPTDGGTCVYGGASERFDSSTHYDSSPNIMDTASFAQDTTITAVKAAPQACVQCADSSRHFYHVILAR